MKQNKKWVILLAVIAVIIWGYNLLQVSMQIRNNRGDNSPNGKEQKTLLLKPVADYQGNFRDPFEPLITIQDQLAASFSSRPSNKTPPLNISAPKETPPKIMLNGIMWDPVKPVAVLLFPDGSTQVVSVGQNIDGITVQSINKTSVSLSKGKLKWTLE
jgi:type IV pilus biogenesis protein PilP